MNYSQILPIWQILFLFLFASFGFNKLFLFLCVQKLAPRIYSHSYPREKYYSLITGSLATWLGHLGLWAFVQRAATRKLEMLPLVRGLGCLLLDALGHSWVGCTKCSALVMTGSSKLFPDGPTHVCRGLVPHYKNVYAAEFRGNINPLGSSDEDRENKALGTTSQNESFEDAIGVGDQDVKLVDDNKENPGAILRAKWPKLKTHEFSLCLVRTSSTGSTALCSLYPSVWQTWRGLRRRRQGCLGQCHWCVWARRPGLPDAQPVCAACVRHRWETIFTGEWWTALVTWPISARTVSGPVNRRALICPALPSIFWGTGMLTGTWWHLPTILWLKFLLWKCFCLRFR